MYYYKTISLTFLISNILSGFLITLIIICGFFLSIISFININIAQILGIPYKILIQLLLKITETIAQIPISKIYVKTPYLYQIIAYYILIFTVRLLNKNRTNTQNQKIQNPNNRSNTHNYTNTKPNRRSAKKQPKTLLHRRRTRRFNPNHNTKQSNHTNRRRRQRNLRHTAKQPCYHIS